MGIEELDRMSPKVREKYLEIIQAIPPGRRIEIAVDFCDTVRQLVMDVIRSENPSASEDFILAEFRKRILPEDIRRRVYGS